MADEGRYSKPKLEGVWPIAGEGLAPGLLPAVGSSAPPPSPADIQFAALDAQSIAAKRPRIHGFCGGSPSGGLLGLSSSAGSGGGGLLGFSSSAGSGGGGLRFSSPAGGSNGGIGYSSIAGGGSNSIGYSSSACGHLVLSSSAGGACFSSSAGNSGADTQAISHTSAMAVSQNLRSASQMTGVVTQASTTASAQNHNAAGPTNLLRKIPTSKMGLVIGRKRDTINWMQSKSGASIQVLPGATASETTVQISGKPDKVNTAKELLDDLLRQGPPKLNWGYPGRPPKKESLSRWSTPTLG